MADSIPSLRRKNKELEDRISELESIQQKPFDRLIYVDNPDHIEMIKALQSRIRELTAENDV